MIGGNKVLTLKAKEVTENDMGLQTASYTKTVASSKGFLDYVTGEANLSPNFQKLEQSSHIFICDYSKAVADANAEECKAYVDGCEYDVALIDDPMELHRHIEIYLKLVGGQDGC